MSKEMITIQELAQRLEALEAEVATLRRMMSGKESLDDLDDRDRQLFDALAEWRREQADREGKRPFHVFGNRTLTTIASVRPTTAADYAAIKGVGPERMQYAEAIVAIVGSHSW